MKPRDRQILQIALPSIVSNITVPLLGLIDVAIVGHLGSPAYMSTIAEYVTDQEVFEQFKAKIEEQRQAILNGDIQVVHGALGERFER